MYSSERKEVYNIPQTGPEECCVGHEGECCVPASDCAVLLRAVIFGLSQHYENENCQPARYSLDMAMRLVRPQN